MLRSLPAGLVLRDAGKDRVNVRRNFTLRFALISGLVVIAVTTTLSSLASASIRASTVDREARQVSDQVQQLVTHSFTRAEFERGLSPKKQALLDALSSDPKNANVLRILLWSREGTLLYSGDRRGVGRRMPLSDGLRIALGGSMTVLPLAPERLRPFTAETMYLSVEGYLELLLFQERRVWIRTGQQASSPATTRTARTSITKAASLGVARLFLPVLVGESTAPVAAFEVFYDFRPLARKLARIQQTVWTAIPGGFLAIYCAMVVAVQRTSRVMMAQQKNLRVAHLGTFHALARAVDARDSETGDHSSRVASYAVAMGRRLGLSIEEIAELKIAAELHDIGKIGVPDAILMKPGPLTSEEWDLMRQHAIVGSNILQSTPLSEVVKQAVRHVHESWGGRGYPDSLHGEQIPVFARIVAVADAFEAMTSKRPYRRPFTTEQALTELRRVRGIQFDPKVVDAMVEVARDIPRRSISMASGRKAAR